MTLFRLKRDFGITTAVIIAISAAATAATVAGIAMTTTVQTAATLNNLSTKVAQALDSQTALDSHIKGGLMVVNQRIDLVQEQLDMLWQLAQLGCEWKFNALCITSVPYENYTRAANLSCSLSLHLAGNWSEEFDVLGGLRRAVVAINSTRVDLSLAEGMTSWITSAVSLFKEWVGTLVPLSSLDDFLCTLKALNSLHSDGNMVIAALVPLFHYYLRKTDDLRGEDMRDLWFKWRSYQFSLAFIFAIEEINRNTHLLPNTSLGFDLYHVPSNQWHILREAFTCLTGARIIIPNYTCRGQKKAAALLTGTSWATSAHIGRLLNLYKYPQINFGPFDTMLSDRAQFTSLYQTAPKDTSLSQGIVILMIHFSWTWVGLVLIDDHNGAEILSDLRREMDRNRVCIAFVEMIQDNLISSNDFSRTTYLKILKSSANVVFIYGDTESSHGIIINTGIRLMNGKVWIMRSQWDSTTDFEYFIFDSFHGSLIFAHHRAEISDFRKFVQTYNPSKYPEDGYLAVLWNTYFNCPFSGPDCKILSSCLPNVSLEMLPKNVWEIDMTEESYNVYNSVYAVAHSLHEMTLKQVQVQPHGNGEISKFPWELHPFLKNIHFKNGAGNLVVLDSQRKLDAEYDILNFWNFPDGLRQKMKVGTFSPKAPQGQELCLSDHMIQWATGFTELPCSVCSESCVPGFRKSSQEGKVACCYDCIRCPDNEISNETDVDHCVRCPESHYANAQQNHCLQKAVTFLSYEDPLGMALTCLALVFSALTAGVLCVFVKYHHTPIVKANNQALTYILLITLIFCFLCPLIFIGHPNTATCILQQSTFAVLFTVALSTILAKTITVVLAFKITLPGRLTRWIMISRAPNFIIPTCTLIQLVLCGIWLSTSPPFIESDAYTEHGHIIIICNKGSTLAFHSVLAYLCSMALGSYTLAYLSRNLPDTFNEAKFITFSMLVFFSVWLTFLPVYHSTKGKLMVAMEVFSILASSAGLLGCIFFPKCCIILLRPHRNVLSHVRNKAYSRRKVNLIA
ncbi:vomeronasal type-2 receptor 116-like [Peromyscus leucopus]|uniref:vomeronasal type-2 receptor 116-like n=1 Tax=Peromyscus leucopus TaxID=10041 RepID=UPI001884D0D8|nr:vomeronasal type-2 receptor 116-like [Peromyscus leucopus]